MQRKHAIIYFFKVPNLILEVTTNYLLQNTYL